MTTVRLHGYLKQVSVLVLRSFILSVFQSPVYLWTRWSEDKDVLDKVPKTGEKEVFSSSRWFK